MTFGLEIRTQLALVQERVQTVADVRRGRSGAIAGAHFGVLIGLFVVCAFVLHNYVNLNIGLKLALGQAVAYFFQWAIIGLVIGLFYKPLAPR